MKTTAVIVLSVLLSGTAHGTDGDDSRSQAGAVRQSEAHGEVAASDRQQVRPAASVEEFVRRTVDVARHQAEQEVHHETRRKVNQLFNRLLDR